MTSADVVVVGGGCSGTSIAWQLAARGAGRVVLIERDGLAAGGTGRSSAIVRTHYTHEVLARMALHARGVFERFDEVVGGECGFRQVGFLAIYRAADVPALAANVAMNQAVGIDAQLLDAAGVADVEPRLDGTDVGGGAWEPRSGYADPVLTTNAFAAAAVRLGVERRIGPHALAVRVAGERVVGVDTDQGHISTRSVVVAAGFRSQALLQPLGLDLAVTPVRHDIAIVQRTPDFGVPHPVVADRITTSYYRPEGDDLTLLGFSPPFDGQIDPDIERDQAPSADATRTLVERYCQRFPSQERAGLRRGYSGVYDVTPDLQPYLGPVPGFDGLHVAFGFSGHGFKLSPAVGELVAERLVEGRTSLVDLEFFSPLRLQQQRAISSPHTYSVVTLG